jgi:hypothetical protein
MDKFFQYLNFFPLPLWLAMMFAPRHPLTERASRSSALLGLASLHYVIALGLAFRPRPGERRARLDFTSLNAVQALLSTRGGTLAAWAHMLAFDLFTGTWIYRESRRLDAPAWVRIPSLFFALMFGPSGLVMFLLWRALGAGKGEALAGEEM